MEGVSERFVTTRSGIRVHVVEAGEPESPAVLFVPGWACTTWIFHDTLVPFSANGFRAIAVELKGHGLSDKPVAAEEYTTESMRDHLLEVIDALELRHCGLLGHSMGAAICGAAAAAKPEKISRLVLAAPAGFDGVRGMTFFRLITPKFLEPLLPWLASRTIVRLTLNIVYGSLKRPTERDVDEFHSPMKMSGFTTAMRSLLHCFNWDAPFPNLVMPTLIIVGSEDVLSPASDVDRYVGPSSTAVVIENSGHVLFDEAPEKVNTILSKFFKPLREAYISF